jgi:hypothetical protein
LIKGRGSAVAGNSWHEVNVSHDRIQQRSCRSQTYSY